MHRAAITLAYKNVEHKLSFIGLADPPDWFVEISPLQKVDDWAKKLMALPAVKNSVGHEFETLFVAALEKANTYSWTRIAA